MVAMSFRVSCSRSTALAKFRGNDQLKQSGIAGLLPRPELAWISETDPDGPKARMLPVSLCMALSRAR